MTVSNPQLRLSGGLGNYDPSQSFGGKMSSVSIAAGKNNLFDNANATETSNGMVDYRCFYVYNTSATDGFTNVRVQLESITGEIDVFLGIKTAKETQKINITGSVSGGNLVLDYEGTEITVAYDNLISVWTQNLLDALNALVPGFTCKEVIRTQERTSFTVCFPNNESYSLLTVKNNNLTGWYGSTPTADISRLINGSPINSTPSKAESEFVLPQGVYFTTNPLVIGPLSAKEFVPIWAKRVIPVGSVSAQDIGFSLSVTADR